MANVTVLRIGGDEVRTWRWKVPHDPFLDFIFQPSDKVVRKVPDIPAEWDRDHHPFECLYETTVGAVEDRLDRLGLSRDTIESTATSRVDIPQEDAPLLLLDGDDYFERYQGRNAEVSDESKKREIARRRYEIQKAAERVHLGYLPELWRLTRVLGEYEEDDPVVLDPREVWEWHRDSEWFDSKNPVRHELDTKVPLDLEYIESARTHLTTHQFHLAYIELAVALEMSIKAFVEGRCDELGLETNVEKIFEDLSLPQALKFAAFVLGDLDLETEQISAALRAYNKRNNVVHRRARRFSIADTAEAIKAVDEVVSAFHRASQDSGAQGSSGQA